MLIMIYIRMVLLKMLIMIYIRMVLLRIRVRRMKRSSPLEGKRVIIKARRRADSIPARVKRIRVKRMPSRSWKMREMWQRRMERERIRSSMIIRK
jgi:hypothetical protein